MALQEAMAMTGLLSSTQVTCLYPYAMAGSPEILGLAMAGTGLTHGAGLNAEAGTGLVYCTASYAMSGTP